MTYLLVCTWNTKSIRWFLLWSFSFWHTRESSGAQIFWWVCHEEQGLSSLVYHGVVYSILTNGNLVSSNIVSFNASTAICITEKWKAFTRLKSSQKMNMLEARKSILKNLLPLLTSIIACLTVINIF